MKKYTNTEHRQVCIKFKNVAQFLRRGDSIITDEEVVFLPKGVLVEDVLSKSK